MKKLILVRHGETSSDKSDPKRALTVKGVEQSRKLGKVLRRLISGPVIVICSKKDRAVQTGEIIAEEIGINGVETEDIRIRNMDNLKSVIEENERAGRRPARTFLSLPKSKLNGAESAVEFSSRVMKILKKKKAETIIVVSHDASLEALLENFKQFRVIKKSFKKYFNNCDFALLVKA